MFSSLRRAVLPLVVGGLLAVPSTAALALGPAPATKGARQRSELFLAEGDAASAAERWEEAISKYRASYYGLPPEDQGLYLGSLPVRKAMRAYEKRIAQEQDPNKQHALRQRQLVLLDEFLDAMAAEPNAGQAVGDDVIAELQQTHASLEDTLAQTEDTEPPPEATTTAPDALPPPKIVETSPTCPPPTTDGPRAQRDWLGLGLVIGGSTTLAAGLGVSVAWFTIRANAQQLADAGGSDFAEGTGAREDYLDGEYARAQKFIIAGSIVAGVGLGTLIGGVTRLVVHRRRATADATALYVSPLLGSGMAGLFVRRRF